MKKSFDEAKLVDEIDNIKKECKKKAEEIYNKGDDKIMNKKGDKNEKELKKELEDFLKNEMNDLINTKIPNAFEKLTKNLNELGKSFGDVFNSLSVALSSIFSVFQNITLFLAFYGIFSGIVITSAFVITAIAESSLIAGGLVASSVASVLVLPITIGVGILGLIGFGIYSIIGIVTYSAATAFTLFYFEIGLMICDAINALNMVYNQLQQNVEKTKNQTIEPLEKNLLQKIDPIIIESLSNDSDSIKIDFNLDLKNVIY